MPDRDFDKDDGRWIMVMHEFIVALAKSDLNGSERRFLDCLMLEAWGKEHEAWAVLRWKYILEFTGLSSGAASKAKVRLEARNIIKCFQMEAKRGLKYRINSKVGSWKKCFQMEALPNGSESASKRKQHPIKKYKKGGKGGKPDKPKKPTWKIPTGAELSVENPWIDQVAWDEFVVHRENIRHKLTELSVTKAVNLLGKFPDHQKQMIDKTILNNWRGLFPPKRTATKSRGKAEATVGHFARRHYDRKKQS